MKRMGLFLGGAAAVLLSFSACSSSEDTASSLLSSQAGMETSLPENVRVEKNVLGVPTYEVTTPVEIQYPTGGNQYVEWFNTTNERVISDLNNRLGERGYAALKVLNPDHPETYSYDGSTWTLSFNNTRGVDKTMVYQIELNLAVPDSETAKLKGFYVAALIDMFNPGQRELITSTLGIYKSKSERESKTVHMIAGNTKYTLKTGEGEVADRLILTPVNSSVSDPTKVPANPSE